MLSWKEKVAEKLSRLFADTPSSPSHLPMDSSIVRPEPSQAISLYAEEIPSPKKSAISSYFSSLIPSAVCDVDEEKANTPGIRSLSLRSFQRRWKANGDSWQDKTLVFYPECEAGNKRDEDIMIVIDSKDDASERNINSSDLIEEASSDCPTTLISGVGKNDISAMNGTCSNAMEEASTSHDTYDMEEFCYLTERSTFINASLFEFLQSSLPNIVKGCKWVLVYSTWKHGISLHTLLRRSVNLPGPCVLIVGDMQGAVFGGLLDCPLRPTAKRKYQGTNQTFVFTTIYGEPRLFRATGANRYYYLCLNDILAFGGGGNFALCLDEDLLHGTSGPCDTYGNLCLAHSPEFELKNVELWGFVHPSLYNT